MLVLSGCSNNYTFMDKAKVGTVGKHNIVMFDAGTRNGVQYYRPQFTSDCGKIYNAYYDSDNNSVTCLIRAERITNLRNYR